MIVKDSVAPPNPLITEAVAWTQLARGDVVRRGRSRWVVTERWISQSDQGVRLSIREIDNEGREIGPSETINASRSGHPADRVVGDRRRCAWYCSSTARRIANG